MGGVRLTSPPGISLDLSFMTPGTLPSGVTFTRASTGTYFDATGTMQSATTNTPRWDYDPVTHALRGMLIEEARTNLLLNSATLGTQSVTTTAVATTLSFYGTGTVTLTGTSTAGPLTGTGVSNRVSLTFTPTAGTLTLTVTGTVTNAQLEAGAFATSYVPTTGTTATRAIEVCQTPTGAWFTSNATLSLNMEIILASNLSRTLGGISDTVLANAFYLGTGGSGNYQALRPGTGGGTLTDGASATGSVQKVGASYNATTMAECANGGTVSSLAITAAALTTATRVGIGNDPWGLTTAFCGWMRRVRYWPRALSNAELQQVTT